MVISLLEIPYIHRIYVWSWPTLITTLARGTPCSGGEGDQVHAAFLLYNPFHFKSSHLVPLLQNNDRVSCKRQTLRWRSGWPSPCCCYSFAAQALRWYLPPPCPIRSGLVYASGTAWLLFPVLLFGRRASEDRVRTRGCINNRLHKCKKMCPLVLCDA
jgi:hypothetical protein